MCRFFRSLLVSILWLTICPIVEACNLPFAASVEIALEWAAKENKPVLVFFTGSDWSPRSVKLDKSVLETVSVEDFITQFFIPVLIDFPQRRKLEEARQSANLKLAEKFEVTDFPTVVAMATDGHELGRLVFGSQSAEEVLQLLKDWAALVGR